FFPIVEPTLVAAFSFDVDLQPLHTPPASLYIRLHARTRPPVKLRAAWNLVAVMQTLSKPVAGRFPAVEKFFKNPSSSKTPIIASAALLSLSVAIINHFARKRTLGSVAPSSTALRRRRQSTYATDHASPETLAAHKKLFPPVDTMRKVGVNGEFWRQISAIFKIIIPDLKSKEVFILLMHSMFLVLRTWLSVVVARLDGQIVRDLVAANGKAFLRGLGYWFAIAIPATYTNSMIRYLQSKLSIAFRSRLTRYVHDLYLDDKIAYYKLINLVCSFI
ncbi:ABC transporter transmembrane region 2-domain-containing protein, partial [Endogone sp. FLAS-F59071]